jgi:predicted enzyme related to lactoylglutathione lyase
LNTIAPFFIVEEDLAATLAFYQPSCGSTFSIRAQAMEPEMTSSPSLGATG